ncbi:MAG: hypothetical protein AAF662_03270, partial [Pseudomonadota bacterium]
DTTQSDTTTTDVRATQDALGRPAVLLSAFFGLDDALPAVAERIFCDGAGGIDGMPVVFSHEVDLATLQAGDFKVVSASGVIGPVLCVTPAPANDIGEARTILLIGQYGSAEDAPAQVEIVGNLLSKDGQLNFRGAKTEVIPLEDGPTLVWAEVVPEAEWTLGDGGTAFPGGGGDSCPIGTKQVVRATWAGGVSKPGGAAIDDAERAAYRVTVRVGEEESDVVPFALADLNDGDNNHELCLDRGGEPLRVSFPAGLMSDPRDDLNPATRVAVTGAS